MNNVSRLEIAKARRANPTASLFAALAAAQGEFPRIGKTKKGHGYYYAPLESIQTAVRPVLAKHGIGFYQHVDGAHMVTVLFHASGESVSVRFPMHKIGGRMNPMQEAGAMSTYAARYGLCLALGISADEDIDASEQGSAGASVTDDWRDPRNDDLGTGVKGAKVESDASPAEKAAAYASGIIEQISNAKRLDGLEGVMRRNEAVIERLRESYDADHQNVLDAYSARYNALTEE